MTPEILALISLAVKVLEVHGPELVKAMSRPDISPEEQALLRERYNELRQATAFAGPQWAQSNGGTGDGGQQAR